MQDMGKRWIQKLTVKKMKKRKKLTVKSLSFFTTDKQNATHTDTHECFINIKMKKILLATFWMNLEEVELRKVIQAQSEKRHVMCAD